MSFLSDFETQLTSAFTDVVTPVSAAVASGFRPIFVAGFSIWILMISYEVAWGKTEDGMTFILTKIGKIFFIGLVALYGWGSIRELAEALRMGFVSFVSCSGGGCAGTISEALELNLLTPLGQVWRNLYLSMIDALSVWSVFSFDFLAQCFLMLCAAVVYAGLTVCVALLSIVTLAMYMVSFASFQLMMAVGPFFLLCLSFPVTQKFFETWTGAVMTAIMAMTFTALLAVMAASLLGLNTVVTATTTIDWSGSYDFIVAMLAKCGYALLLVYLYYKVFDLAASLGGGMNMGNNMTGAVRTLARDLMRQSGGRGGSGSANSLGQGRGGSAPSGSGRGGFGAAVAANHSLTGMGITAGGRAAMAGGRVAMAGASAGGRAAMAGARAAGGAGAQIGRFAYNRGVSAAVAARRLFK